MLEEAATVACILQEPDLADMLPGPGMSVLAARPTVTGRSRARRGRGNSGHATSGDTDRLSASL